MNWDDRNRLSKSRDSTTYQLRFVSTETSLVKNCCNWQERSSNSCLFEDKCFNFGAGKPKLRRFQIRRFCNKMRPFSSNFSRNILENPSKKYTEKKDNTKVIEIFSDYLLLMTSHIASVTWLWRILDYENIISAFLKGKCSFSHFGA